MKRVVSSSLITLFILVVVAASFLYLRNFKNESGDPVIAIPADFSFFIVYHPSEKNFDEIISGGPWSALMAAPVFSNLKKSLDTISAYSQNNPKFHEFFNATPTVISAHVTSATDFDFLYLKNIPNEFKEDDIDDLMLDLAGNDAVVTKRNYDGNNIREVQLPSKKVFCYAFSKGILISSFTSFIVEDALRQLKVGKRNNDDFKILSKSFESTGINVYINFNKLASFLGIFTENDKIAGLENLKTYARLSGAGMKLTGNQISFKGLVYSPDSSSLQNCFNEQEPVDLNLLNILPAKSAVVNYYGLSNFNNFYEHYTHYYFNRDQADRKTKIIKKIKSEFDIDIESEMMAWQGGEYAFVISEPSGMKYDNNCYAVFKAADIGKAGKILKKIGASIDSKGGFNSMQESYGSHQIGLIRLNGVLPALFGDVFNRVNGMYYTTIENYVVFANQASSLRSYIDEINKKSFLVNIPHINSVLKSIPAKGNHLFLVRPSSAFYVFKSVANNEWKDYANKYRDVISNAGSFVYLMSAGKPINWFNSVLSFENGNAAPGISSLFSVDADSSVSMQPLLSTDPVSNSRQILFQDDAGIIYMCDNSGNTIWKQELSGQILGKIHEIDLFKNNTRQFLFNTRDYMYLLDVDGRPVGNYPIRLPAPATNGISVLEFENSKEPRIYIACENKAVYAYQPSGRPLPGWVFRELTGNVNSEIKKVNIDGRYYLFIADDLGNIFIIKSFGEPGIKVNERVIISKNAKLFNDSDGSLVFTDYRGNVIRIKPDGNVETIPLNAADDGHGFLYADADSDGEKDYIFLNRSELLVYNKNLILIYRKDFEQIISGGLEMFELKSGRRVMGIRSEDSDLCWLLEMNGEVVEGFPVKGSGSPVFDELNLDGNKNMFIGGKDNRLHVYSVQSY